MVPEDKFLEAPQWHVNMGLLKVSVDRLAAWCFLAQIFSKGPMVSLQKSGSTFTLCTNFGSAYAPGSVFITDYNCSENNGKYWFST